MNQKLWEDILTILAVMIVSDGRTRDPEIQAFVDGVARLQTALEPNAHTPETMLRQWFDLNEKRVRALTHSSPINVGLAPLLTRLTALDDLQILLDQLDAIADADLHKDQSETDLILLASAFWGLVAPSRRAA